MQIYSQLVPLALGNANGSAVAMGFLTASTLATAPSSRGGPVGKSPRGIPGGIHVQIAHRKQDERQAPPLHRG